MRIIDFFDNGAKYYPTQTAFVDMEQGDAATSYTEAHAASHRIAAAIRGKGTARRAHRHPGAQQHDRVARLARPVPRGRRVAADQSAQPGAGECRPALAVRRRAPSVS